MHCALNVANNPELSSFCIEGNVLHGGLDTSEVKDSCTESAVKSNKRKERQSNTKHQEDVLNYMKERNLGDSRSRKVTMLKDLTIALSVLNTTWIEMDNKIVALEDDNDLDTNPRKQARLANYKSILRENGVFRNRKKFISQNDVLAVTNFNLTFSYALCGWE